MPHKIRVRSLLLGAAFTLLFILLIGRLYWLQIVESPWLTARAQAMWDREETLPAMRGTIYDRKLEVLAGDAKGYTVVLNPRLLNELGLAREAARGLSQVLGVSEPALYEHATNRDANGNYRMYRQIGNEGRKLNEEKAQLIREWKDAFVKEHGIKGDNWQGVTLEEERMRNYPKGTLAAHILGFVNKNGDAAAGLELALDDVLRGTPGKVAYQKDQKGRRLPDSKPELVAPVNGQDIVLTIDQTIQHYTQAALEKAYEQYKPKGMTAIAVDPRTMEVLALANLPTYDPNEYWKYDPEKNFKNMAVQSRYEPGSTFKLVTLAGAVDQRLFHPNDKYKSGSIVVGGAPLRDHRRGGWGDITYLEGLLRSSNVAFVKLGYEMMGEEKLREYIDRFGFTRKTGIDLPGEVEPRIQFRYASEIATTTYGQGGAIVTPIQQIAAYAAIANGGKLMKPYVVKRVVDSATKEVIAETAPTLVAQVVSPEIAREVTDYLAQVVSSDIGTGRRARIDGYEVAGKTGTANIVVNGTYSEDTWVVSFIGFAPADDPRIAVAVIVDQPDLGGDSNRAGEVTGGVFKEIVSQSLRYLGVRPNTELPVAIASFGGEALVPVPDLTGLRPDAAAKELGAHGFQWRMVGAGPTVVGQYPAAGERMPESAEVYLLTVPQEEAPVPNVIGASLRDVVQLCALLGLLCEAEGEGFVIEQEVVETDAGAALRVRLAPPGTPADPSGSGSGGEAPEGGASGDGEAGGQPGEGGSDGGDSSRGGSSEGGSGDGGSAKGGADAAGAAGA